MSVNDTDNGNNPSLTEATPVNDVLANDALTIAGLRFTSRLMVGTGKFPSPQAVTATVEQSGSEIVTVALRRVDLASGGDPTLSALDLSRLKVLLPNTSGARNADEAVRLAQLARKMLRHAPVPDNWVKLEVTPDPVTLLPDPIETFAAAKRLVEEGFVVLPYIHADYILARRLEEIGCATVMPLAAPIGTNKGLKTRDTIAKIIETARVPVVVDAGLGRPSHAAEAMEMGADAVLVNTALATANDCGQMGAAFAEAVRAGRRGYLAGFGAESEQARASSPLTGFLETLDG